nr:hypothetical protein [Nanoarchaeum sp.]
MDNIITNTPQPVHHKKTSKWKVATVVLAVLLIVSIIGSSYISMMAISGNAVATNAVDFINAELLQGQATATLQDAEKDTKLGLIKATVLVGGQPTPVYISKDGKTMFLNAIDLTTKSTDTPVQESPAVDVPKSDKPEVELFVMSECPYGTQIEKGILPVVKVLENDIDFKVKFVYYAMHGEKEVKEQLNQYCIQEEQNDKYLDYLYCYLDAGDGETCLETAGIDTTKLKTCTEAADEEFEITKNFEDQASWLSGRFPLFNTDKADNEKYQIAGSPGLVINGEVVSSARDSASLLKAICGAFNTEPEACVQQFSATAPGAGFGWDTTSANNAAAAGCGV